MAMLVTQYTLNTQELTSLAPAEWEPSEQEAVADLVRAAGGCLDGRFSSFRVEITGGDGGSTFRILHGDELVCVCGVSWCQDVARWIWSALRSFYLELRCESPHLFEADRFPVMPAAVPWLSIVFLPGTKPRSPADSARLQALVPLLAHAIIEAADLEAPAPVLTATVV